MRWTLVLLFVCCACQSKPVSSPVTEPAQVAPAAGKATPTIEVPRGIYSKTVTSPRSDLETNVTLNPAIQNCLRSASDLVFVTLEGQAPKVGNLRGRAIKADGADDPCLSRALNSISLTKGAKGPFKIELGTDPKRFPGAKGLLLAPPPVKKFQ